MKRVFILILGILLATGSAYAVPVLQVGAPGGPGEGTYADYGGPYSNPTETDTAVTYGAMLYFAGVYQNKDVLNLGGQFGTGSDWSAFGYPANYFTGRGAVVMASVPDGQSGSLQIDGAGAFYSSATLDGLFPNNHDPLKDGVSDFLFFDIGDFAKIAGAVPDFDPETGAADGEIKSLGISVSGYSWVHFDLLALETSTQGRTNIVTTVENNPGSHDVTWKDPGTPVPEPATMLMLGIGLLGLVGTARRKGAAA